MGKERKTENVELGKRLAKVQSAHGKTDIQMAYITGYAVHTYQCVINGDQSMSLRHLSMLAKDPDFAGEILYILTGQRADFDYSIAGNEAYIETLSAKERERYIRKLALLVAKELAQR